MGRFQTQNQNRNRQYGFVEIETQPNGFPLGSVLWVRFGRFCSVYRFLGSILLSPSICNWNDWITSPFTLI